MLALLVYRVAEQMLYCSFCEFVFKKILSLSKLSLCKFFITNQHYIKNKIILFLILTFKIIYNNFFCLLINLQNKLFYIYQNLLNQHNICWQCLNRDAKFCK